MKTLAIYKLIACFYDLLDVIYFRDKGKNPRKAFRLVKYGGRNSCFFQFSYWNQSPITAL